MERRQLARHQVVLKGLMMMIRTNYTFTLERLLNGRNDETSTTFLLSFLWFVSLSSNDPIIFCPSFRLVRWRQQTIQQLYNKCHLLSQLDYYQYLGSDRNIISFSQNGNSYPLPISNLANNFP